MIVNIPEDIYSYESKSCGIFTTRQLICTLLSFLVIAPTFILLFLLTYSPDLSALVSILLGVPIIMCGIFKKDGQFLEKIIMYKWQWKFKYPQKRKFVMSNLYEDVERLQKECEQRNDNEEIKKTNASKKKK